MRWLHGAAFMGCHLIRFMSALPVPRGLYMWFHDLSEPRLRRLCECRPQCWCGVWRRVYNASPPAFRAVLLIVAFPWGRR